MLSVMMLVVVGLATWQAVEVYRHSPLFETWRKTAEMFDDWFSQLSSCGWCLSVWVAFALIVLWYILPIIPLALAVSRIANIFHDVYGHVEEQNQNAREDRERDLVHRANMLELQKTNTDRWARQRVTLNYDDEVRKDI